MSSSFSGPLIMSFIIWIIGNRQMLYGILQLGSCKDLCLMAAIAATLTLVTVLVVKENMMMWPGSREGDCSGDTRQCWCRGEEHSRPHNTLETTAWVPRPQVSPPGQCHQPQSAWRPPDTCPCPPSPPHWHLTLPGEHSGETNTTPSSWSLHRHQPTDHMCWRDSAE